MSAATAERRIGIVVNPRSGTPPGQLAQELTGERLAVLEGRCARWERYDADADSLEAALRRAAGENDLLVVAGGDGTVAAAAACAVDAAVPLGIIPAGTMNVLAGELGIPAEVDAALEIVADGRSRRIDVAYVNDRLFLNSVVLGAFGDLAREREALRGAPPSALPRRLPAALAALWRRRPRRLTLCADDRRIELRSQTVAVVSNRVADEMSWPFRREALDAGVFDVFATREESLLAMARLFLRLMAGRPRGDRTTEQLEAQRVRIESHHSSLPAAVDGESMRVACPVEFRLSPRALEVTCRKNGGADV